MSLQYNATIVKRDATKDIAFLDVGTTPDIFFEESTVEVKRLTPVTVLGFPNYNIGDTGNAHSGRVTGFRKNNFYGADYILVDALIMGGNSGGPVIDSSGKVVGIAVRGAASLVKAKETEFHAVIPMSEIKEFRDM